MIHQVGKLFIGEAFEHVIDENLNLLVGDGIHFPDDVLQAISTVLDAMFLVCGVENV